MKLASVANLARAGLLQAAETCPKAAVSAHSLFAQSDVNSQTRSMGTHAAPAAPSGPKTPLQQIVPVVLGIVPATLKAATSTATSLLSALATSEVTAQAVTYTANNLILSEQALAVKDLDLPKWTTWLTTAGYTDKAGLAKLASAATEAAPGFSGADAATLVAAFSKAGFYDRALFTALAGRIRAQFTELETDALLEVAAAYHKAGHTDLDLLDDVADSIAYCNHYLAPVYCTLPAIAGALEAYAAAGHDRTDMFVGLARAVNEDRLMKMEGAARGEVVLSLLRSFDALGFWPDCTEGLFVVADNTPSLHGHAEVADLLAKVTEKAGGDLKYYREGAKDPEHYHGPSFGDYNLWAFRDSLLPKAYAPSALRKA